jgi:hypothetical protein
VDTARWEEEHHRLELQCRLRDRCRLDDQFGIAHVLVEARSGSYVQIDRQICVSSSLCNDDIRGRMIFSTALVYLVPKLVREIRDENEILVLFPNLPTFGLQTTELQPIRTLDGHFKLPFNRCYHNITNSHLFFQAIVVGTSCWFVSDFSSFNAWRAASMIWAGVGAATRTDMKTLWDGRPLTARSTLSLHEHHPLINNYHRSSNCASAETQMVLLMG